jgi:phosphocarrier protein
VSDLVQQTVEIKNDLGLHLRAAGALVQVASRFDCEVWLKRGSADANAKSIMSVLSLAAGKGTQLLVVARGTDAPEAVSAVAALIDGGFKH